MDDIEFVVRDGIARVVLNRPDALNALTLEMAQALDGKLREWEGDASVQCVLARGQGSRAFCAGGDIRKLYDERAGDYPRRFYRTEYRLNARLHRFPKPYIAFMDGIANTVVSLATRWLPCTDTPTPPPMTMPLISAT